MEFSWMITAFLGFVLIYLIYWYLLKKLSFWQERGVPCVDSVPFIGSIGDVIRGKKNYIQLVADFHKRFKNEKYFGMYMLQSPVLVIRDPDLITQFLVKDFSYFQDRNVDVDETIDVMSAGLVNLTGNKWRILRHKMTPAFTSGKMKLMFKDVKDCCDEAVLVLKGMRGEDVELRSFLFKVVINIVGIIAFGIKVNAFNINGEKENAFLENSKNFLKPNLMLHIKAVVALVNPKIRDFFKYRLVDDRINNFFPKLTKDLMDYRERTGEKRNDFLQTLLDHKHKELELAKETSVNGQITQTSDTDVHDGGEPEDRELLDHLKNIKYNQTSAVFSDYIIASQTFLFISAGSDTTASIISFALHELASNKDIQRRLQNEIDSVLSNQELTYDALKKMTYMDQIIYEVLRQRPGSGVLTRVCTQDYKMPGTDLVIPKGCVINISLLALHMDPEYFPDPEKFNPDRFKNMDEIPKNIFYPFGAGPRICIAMRLAMLQMKVFLATLLSSYDLILSEKTQLPIKISSQSLTQHVVGGLWVRFEPREIR
ncbi:putative cytochrome P450 6a14 isoform X2 [Lycorma delicatula]